MMWFVFKLKSTNFVVVIASDAVSAKSKFKSVWPREVARVAEKGDRMSEVPEGAIEVLHA
jgi:hypothetical protein